MIHLPDQIQDLGYILIIAAVVTLIFKRLRQPVVLGYLVAGFLLGPHVTFLPTIADPEGVKVWAEIGVIFLLFGLGLEFSFKKLAAVGKTASITAGVEVIVMLGLGYLAGQVMGWSKMDSIFLGGILSISSTTIIVRAFDELGLKGRRFVSIVFGVLIVEDLIAILLLALLSTIAATQTVAGGTLALAGLKLGFSLILWFLVGIYLVPVFLRKIHGYLNDETTLVVSIGLCLLLVIIATKAGFSPALGAFVMGSIIAETRDGKRIEHLLMPVKDLFAAIFFVSVGMLIDPRVLYEYGWVIAGITLLTIVGKFFSSAIGALLAGQALRHSVQAGMSLAQIGEFSFIIATLGVTLKVTSDFLYPVAVAVSAITTFTTPYLIREADRFAGFLEKRLPPTLVTRLERYQSAFHDRGPSGSALGLLWDAYGIKVALNSVVIVAVTLAGTRLLLPAIDARFGEHGWTTMVAGALALVACSPFLWAIVFGAAAKQALADAECLARLKGLQTGATLVRWMIGATLVLFVVSQFATTHATFGVAILLVFLVGAFFSRFAEPVYSAVEERFLANLDDKEREELSRTPARAPLAPWNAALAELVLSPDSDLAGKSLMDSALKERFGVTIALIERGHRRVLAPGRNDLLLPGDRLHLIGTEEQILAARPVIEQTGGPVPLADLNFGLEAVRLPPQSRFLNKPIRDSGLREAINGLIVGIEREGKRMLNPDSATTLSAGDLIWVVGDKERIKTL